MTTNKESQAAVTASIPCLAGGHGGWRRPEAAGVLPIFVRLLSRQQVQQWLAGEEQRLYWRALTPLVMLWVMVYQRLQPDHACDAAVAYLRSGAVDQLDADDRHGQPLSQRLRSESTAAYVQGRNRLPLSLVQAALQGVAHQVGQWWQAAPAGGELLCWHARAVRVLDGTTFRLRPYGDLTTTYGQASNQRGESYWTVAKALVSFCLSSQMCIGYAEGAQHASELGLCRNVMQQDDHPHSIYLADQGLAVYRVAQVAQHLGHDVVLRLEPQTAQRLLHLAGQHSLASGQECLVHWQPGPDIVSEPDWPLPAIAGRLIYVRIAPPGFRPFDVYLFTTLGDALTYPLAEICALYARRWSGELDFRHIKTVMMMEEFNVRSAALFRKELAAGLLAYNLVCAAMTQAALQAGLAPTRLSFSRCLRRIAAFLAYVLPACGPAPGDPAQYLLPQLAACRLPCQPNKVRHEPRQVRHRRAKYPPMRGSRHSARQQWLNQMAPPIS